MAIYCLMGKSASGKDTLYRRLKEEYPDLKSIVSYTTRPIRDGETDGIEYHFVTKKIMDKFREDDRLIEMRVYHTVHGDWYYATVADESIRPEEEDYLCIATLESYSKLREYYGAGNTIPLYIEVSDGTRIKRAIEREENQASPDYEELCRRFIADANDFTEEKLFEAGVFCSYCNENLELCMKRLRKRIKQEEI